MVNKVDVSTPATRVTGDLIHDTTKSGYSFSNVVSSSSMDSSYKTPEITIKTTKIPTLKESPSGSMESEAERIARLRQEFQRGEIDANTFLDLILYKRPMTERPKLNRETTRSPKLKVTVMSETPMKNAWETTNTITEVRPIATEPISIKQQSPSFQTTKKPSSPAVFSARTTPIRPMTEGPKFSGNPTESSQTLSAMEPRSENNLNQLITQTDKTTNDHVIKDITPSSEITKNVMGLQMDATPKITRKAFNLLSSGGASLDVLQYHERQASRAGVPSGLGQPADRDLFQREVTGVPIKQQYSGLSFGGLSAQMAPVFADSLGHNSQTMSPDRFDNFDFVNGKSLRRGEVVATTTESWMPRTQVHGSLSQMNGQMNGQLVADPGSFDQFNSGAFGLTAHESFEQNFGLSNSMGKPSIDFTGGSSSLANLGNVVSSGSISSFENRRLGTINNNKFSNGQILWDTNAGNAGHMANRLAGGRIYTPGQMSNFNQFNSGQISNGNNFHPRASPQRRTTRVVNQQLSNQAPNENVQMNWYEFGPQGQRQNTNRLSNGFGSEVPVSASVKSPSQAKKTQSLGSLSNPYNGGLESGVLVSASGQNMEINIAKGAQEKSASDKNVITHSLGSHFAFSPENQGPSDILMPSSQMLSPQKLTSGNFRTFGQNQNSRPNPVYNQQGSEGVLISSNGFGRFNSGFTRPPDTPPTPQPEVPRDIPFPSAGSLSSVRNQPPPPPPPPRPVALVRPRPRPSAPSPNTWVRPSLPSVPSQNLAVEPSGNVCQYREILQCEGRGFHRDQPGIGEECVRMCSGGHCPPKRCYCECRNNMTGVRRPLRTSSPSFQTGRFRGSNV